MKLLYFDCFSGISGDMTLGALIDAGASLPTIQDQLKRLPIESEFEIQVRKVVKKGISATKVDVLVDGEQKNHRHYSDIVKMIKAAGFNEKVTSMALRIFKKIAEAESKIHHIPLEKVHFHEVGAVDSIVDIVGVAVALDELQIEDFLSSTVPVGSGVIPIDHGIYPVPAPATLELLKGIPIHLTTTKGELTTPTGAGILAALVDSFEEAPAFQLEAIGYGAGTKDFDDHPNILRVMVGETKGRVENG